jgi:hypothetical protein
MMGEFRGWIFSIETGQVEVDLGDNLLDAIRQAHILDIVYICDADGNVVAAFDDVNVH